MLDIDDFKNKVIAERNIFLPGQIKGKRHGRVRWSELSAFIKFTVIGQI